MYKEGYDPPYEQQEVVKKCYINDSALGINSLIWNLRVTKPAPHLTTSLQIPWPM